MSVIYSEITELALNNNQSLTKDQHVMVELIAAYLLYNWEFLWSTPDRRD